MDPVEETVGPARVAVVAALVLGTLLAGIGGIALSTPAEATTDWWPAAGVAVLSVLAAPRRWWLRLFVLLGLAYFLANALMGRDLLPSALLAIADTAETVIVTHVLVRTVGRTLHHVQDLWWLVVSSLQGALVAGLGVAATSTWLLGGSFWHTVVATTAAHAAAIVVIAPVLMTPPTLQRLPRIHLVAQSLLVAATVWVSFGGERLNLAFALYPLAVWAAVTLGPRVLAAQQLVVAGGIAVLASDQATAFQVRAVDLPLDLGDQITQIYLLTLVVSGLPLALAMRQRFEAVEVIAARERSVQANFLSSAVPTALLTYDGDRLVFDEVNEPAAAMLRRRASDLDGVDVDEVLSGPTPVAGAARDLADGRQPSWSDTRELGTDPVRHLDVNIALIGKSEGLHRLSMTLHDITEEREMQRRLDQEQEYSRAITDSSPSPILVLDQHGTVLLTNPAALEVSGYTEAELVGRPIWAALVPPEQRHVVERHFASGRRMLLQGESTVVTATGDRRQLIFASRPLDTDAGSQGRQVITASDVTEERKQAQLMSHLLASATTVAFIGTDVDGRITLFNEGAAQMLGLDSREAIGRDFLDFLHQDDLLRRARVTRRPPGFAAVVGPVADGAAPETRDWTWVPRTGSLLQVSMTVSRMTDDLGLTLGYFFVARDVSDTRRSQEILVKALDRERQAVAKLQALDSVRDEFVSTVSHELRTPMTSIIGSAEMLADGLVGPLSDEQRPLVDVIARNGERLLQLANDLLALVQNDVPGWAESVVEVDLRDIVVESHESVASLRSSRALEVVNSLGEAPVPVFGDVQKLERALTNLLSNAIKFTPDGGQVTTSVSADQERGIARLVVSDTGLGIAEQDIPRVFERFFRSTRVQELAIQGTGLGLPIVKDIVESHRGTIAVASRPGQGTSFTIELPLAEALQCRVSAGQQRD